jgi:hypothetical protein
MGMPVRNLQNNMQNTLLSDTQYAINYAEYALVNIQSRNIPLFDYFSMKNMHCQLNNMQNMHIPHSVTKTIVKNEKMLKYIVAEQKYA